MLPRLMDGSSPGDTEARFTPFSEYTTSLSVTIKLSVWWTLHCAVNTGSREYRVPRSRRAWNVYGHGRACMHTSGYLVHSLCSEFIRQNSTAVINCVSALKKIYRVRLSAAT